MTRVRDGIEGGTPGTRIKLSGPESAEITAHAGFGFGLAGAFAVAGNGTSTPAGGGRAIVTAPKTPVAERAAR